LRGFEGVFKWHYSKLEDILKVRDKCYLDDSHQLCRTNSDSVDEGTSFRMDFTGIGHGVLDALDSGLWNKRVGRIGCRRTKRN
jgi:hypothetical protein